MPRRSSPLVVSVGLFSIIPVPPTPNIDRRTASAAMAWFPVVGAVVGAVASFVAWGGTWLGGPLLGPVLAVAALAWLTGALHLDGLADTADGLGSRKPPEQALDIMRRSDIGPMGVVVLLLVLVADVAALSRIAAGSALTAAVALLVAAVLGRVVVVGATTPSGRGARTGGFGALFHGVTPVSTAVLWVVGGVMGAALLGWVAFGFAGALVFGVAASAALGAGWLWRGHLTRRLGGMTGDTFGSIIEVTQAVFLVLAALGFGAIGRLDVHWAIM